MEDKEKILGNELLNDDYINTAQNLKETVPFTDWPWIDFNSWTYVYDGWVCNYIQFLTAVVITGLLSEHFWFDIHFTR